MPTNAILVNEIDLSIPCRKFRISYAVVGQERFPCVTEFAVRLVSVCGGLTVAALQGFFGLTAREVSILVADLLQAQLLTCDGDKLVVGDAVRDQMATSQEALPYLTRFETRDRGVDFELVRFRLAKGNGAASLLAVPVAASTDAQVRALERVRQAFNEQFREYVDSFANERGAREELYRIDAINAGNPFSRSVSASFYLELAGAVPDVRMEPQGADLCSDTAILSSVVADNLQEESSGQDQAHLTELDALFPEAGFKRFIDDAGDFNLVAFAKEATKELELADGRAVVPIMGASYLPRNAALLLHAIRLLRGSGRRKSPKVEWLAPALDTWGRTQHLESLLDALEDYGPRSVTPEAADRGTQTPVTLILPDEAGQQRWPHLSKLANKRGISVTEIPTQTAPQQGNLEILVVAETLAIVLSHVFVPNRRQTSLPVGFLTADPKLVAAARGQLR